jgi:hypothetical protein
LSFEALGLEPSFHPSDTPSNPVKIDERPSLPISSMARGQVTLKAERAFY